MVEHTQRCVHWSPLSYRCAKSKGGIFIPMDDHIENFCLSANCSNCPQLQSAVCRQLTADTSRGVNRRRAVRVDAQEPVTLQAPSRSHLLPVPITTAIKKLAAKTLDISVSGMRLFVPVPLYQDSIVEFSFDGQFPEQLQHGQGKIQWCNKQIDEPGYQMGVAFADSKISKVLEGYLQQRAFA